jgi:hypothetical protein
LVERGGVPSPLPLPTPASLATSPPLPPALPYLRVKYELECAMGGDGSAPGGSRHRNITCLTATPSAAGRLPPPIRSVSSRLLDLYHECMDSGGWARVLYDARGGMEKFLFIRKIEPTPAPTVPAPLHKHGCPASDRRRARDKQRREAWAARRRNCSQSCLHTQAAEDDITPRPASAGTAITYIANSPSSQALITSPPQLASMASPPPAAPPPAAPLPASPSPVSTPPTVSPQPAPPPRKRAKTFSEATRASSRAAVIAKKQQIPQLDGCFSPPSPPSLPRNPAPKFPDEPTLQLAASPAPLAREAPMPPRASHREGRLRHHHHCGERLRRHRRQGPSLTYACLLPQPSDQPRSPRRLLPDLL